MEFDFKDGALEKVYYDPMASIGHGPIVDKGFRKLIGKIRAARNEFDLRTLQGLRFHNLNGRRSHQHAMTITDQWRLVVERKERDGRTRLLIISVEDH